MNEQPGPAPLTGWRRTLVLTVDRWIYFLSKRWLIFFNLAVALYLFLPVLAPVLTVAGAPRVGKALYIAYRPACHQLPERSLFLFGPKLTYSLEELHGAGLISPQDGPLARQRFLGAPGIGFKIALCQRDIALYGTMFIAGLAFGVVRALRKQPVRPLPLWLFGLLLVPMIADGGTQLIMLRESNLVLRTITGALTGFACVWLLYPHLQAAFDDLRIQAEARVR